MGAEVCVGDRIVFHTVGLHWGQAEVIDILPNANGFRAKAMTDAQGTALIGYSYNFRPQAIYYVYQRASKKNEVDFCYEYFYEVIKPTECDPHKIYEALPAEHFQSPNYNSGSTYLKRTPGTGNYDVLAKIETWNYFNFADETREIRRGTIHGVFPHCGQDCVCLSISCKNGQSVDYIPVGLFCPITPKSVERFDTDRTPISQPAPEPGIDYKALARNWRRF